MGIMYFNNTGKGSMGARNKVNRTIAIIPFILSISTAQPIDNADIPVEEFNI